jgi:CheY-like chemotaxis protein
MSKQMIPFCFHPTKTVVVDDDAGLSKWLSVQLSSLGTSEFFTMPDKALKVLCQYKPDFFTKHVTLTHETFDLSHHDKRNLEIDLTKIHEEIYNTKHSEQVAVIIVDYAMPGMTGIEFCKEVRGLPMKKMLLTGEADHTVAVAAFNDGLIDRFLLKSDPDLLEKIEQSVFELQFAYFQDLSRLIFDSLAPRDKYFTNCLSDEKFSRYFVSTLKKKNIKEFYLWDNYVDFLLKDKEEKISWAMIRDAASVKDVVLAAEQAYNEKPTPEGLKILELVRSTKKLPFFYPYYNETWSLEDWKPYLQDMSAVAGSKGEYYVAFVEENEIYSLAQ